MKRQFTNHLLSQLVTGLVVVSAVAGCGSNDSTDDCAPFTSCDAVVDMVINETITGSELNLLCDQWNALTLGEQERLAVDFAAQAEDLSEMEGLGLFEDPEAAATGIVSSFLDNLDTRCS